MVILRDFCRQLTFFKINFFKKLFQEHYQKVEQFGSNMSILILIRTLCKGYLKKNVLWVLIRVLTVCKSYQQTAKVTANRQRVPIISLHAG